MSSTSRFVRFFILLGFFLLVRFFLLVIRTEHKSEHFSSSTEVVRNFTFASFFTLEKESVVEFQDLELGNPISQQDLEIKFSRINEVCEKYNLTENLRRKHFLYSSEHKGLYCWIRKVASTSFTKFFSILKGRRVAANYYKEINFLAPQTIEELKTIINDTSVFKFLVVRHPFERLVSAYRDRIEDNSRYTAQAWIYVPRIFRLTRPELFRNNRTTGNALQQIFYPYKRLKLVPSFEEFVKWLINEPQEKDDEHWFQYHKQCSLCNANFDYVMDLDNYTLNDVNYVFTRLGLDDSAAYLPKIQSTRGGKSDFPRTCNYFRNLSRELVQSLYERYKIDFQMFDYKYENYLNCSLVNTTKL